MSKKDSMMVTMTLSAKQARLLGKLVYWGHSILNLAEPMHGERWHEAMDTLFEAGTEAGMADFSYDRWLDNPPKDVEEYQAVYDKMIMLRQLIYTLATRDIEREYGEQQLEAMDDEEVECLLDERANRYAHVLAEHKFDSIEIKVPENVLSGEV